MRHILDPDVFLTLPDWLAGQHAPAYRGEQIRQWLFAGRAESFDEMSNFAQVAAGTASGRVHDLDHGRGAAPSGGGWNGKTAAAITRRASY